MSDCEEIQDLLEAYELGFLEEAVSRACTEHLSACPACREVLRDVQGTLRLLERLPAAEGSSSGIAGRVLSSVAATGPSPGRRWLWVAAAGWLLAVGLGAWALVATLARDGGAEVALAGISTRLEAQESRLSGLEAARADEARARKSLGAELAARVGGLEPGLEALRLESSRLREELSKLGLALARSEDLSRSVAEIQSREAAMELSLGELAGKLEEQSGALDGLADRVALAERSSRESSGSSRDPADLASRPGPASGAQGLLAEAPARRAPASQPAAPQAHRELAEEAPPPRTPWDAAFKMASGVVKDKDRGRNLRKRIREYQGDLFDIYGSSE